MMMATKDDLGLSLSLNFPQKESQQPQPINHQKPPWMHAFYPQAAKPTSGDSAAAPTFLRGIDVNRPVTCDSDEDLAAVSSPNSTVSSGKRPASDRDPTGSTSSDEDYGENSRKKLRLSKDQSAVLEESFKEHSTLNPKQKQALSKQLGLRPRQVEVWFQNRRARTKFKQTEIDCEFLKRCCENLTEENRRLQKEVQELRALKLSPQFYMPTTLTMCPSCERVGPPPQGMDSKNQQRSSMVFNPWAQSVPGGRNAIRPRS